MKKQRQPYQLQPEEYFPITGGVKYLRRIANQLNNQSSVRLPENFEDHACARIYGIILTNAIIFGPAVYGLTKLLSK